MNVPLIQTHFPYHTAVKWQEITGDESITHYGIVEGKFGDALYWVRDERTQNLERLNWAELTLVPGT